jgi:hypothetical protein
MVDESSLNQSVRCEEVWPEISNYVDGDADAALLAQLDRHFRACPRCASVLAGTRNVVALYGDERMLEVPAGFSRRLAARLQQKLVRSRENKSAWTSSGKAGRATQWSSWSAWMMPVAALVLFAAALALVDRLAFQNPPRSPMADRGHGVPPDMLVVVSDGSKVFHLAGCPFIHDKASQHTITAKQAMHDGYSPCARCMRKYLTASAALTERSVVEDDRAEAEEQGEEAGKPGR